VKRLRVGVVEIKGEGEVGERRGASLKCGSDKVGREV